MRTAEENAAEFGRHSKYGGWQLGLLVACSVEPDTGHGKRPDRAVSKISAREFARRAETKHDRVIRFYDAWERAAAKRIVPTAATLKPSDADNWNLPILSIRTDEDPLT